MGLPTPNPIDTQIFNRGVPINSMGTTQIHCKACGSQKKHERYRVIVSVHFGFGAPFFVAPFKKRASTKGKLGTRAIFAQCHSCTSLWAEDGKAKEFSYTQWGNPDGWISESKQYEMLNQEFKVSESIEAIVNSPETVIPQPNEDAEDPKPIQKSKVRKLPSD